ncbi:MAG TPA: hypothetical protein VLC55_02830 [Burkholderiales bacterium]|nr:hypothetical protein [Burkholderiales bacterium]
MSLDPAVRRPRFAVEVKWSDRPFDDPKAIKGLIDFARLHKPPRMPLVTTVSRSGVRQFGDVAVEFVPASLHCYTVGRNTFVGRGG